MTDVRKRLAELIDAPIGCASDGAAEFPRRKPRLSPRTHTLAEVLGADDETPGQYRKVGPSLRHVASKVDLKFLYNWIREPNDFRPTTKMPQFFGLWDHLTPEPKLNADGSIRRDDAGSRGHGGFSRG